MVIGRCQPDPADPQADQQVCCFYMLRTGIIDTLYVCFDDFTCWLSGEQSLPFGLLVSKFV